MTPHFEEANGRRVLYIDGKPFTVLAVEIPWWNLIYARYKETETAYDALYPAAGRLSGNSAMVSLLFRFIEIIAALRVAVWHPSSVSSAKTPSDLTPFNIPRPNSGNSLLKVVIAQKASVIVGLQPVIQVNVVQIGRYHFFAEFVSFRT